MQELLLGYDIRWSSQATNEYWEIEGNRDALLIAPFIYSPASVDTLVWPSVFNYSPEFRPLNNTVEVQIEEQFDFRQSALGLWGDPLAMVQFYRERVTTDNPDRQAVAIFLMVNDLMLLDENWMARLDPLELSITPTMNDEWVPLGYDVANIDLLSGLSNCGYDQDEVDILRPIWAPRLNGGGLMNNMCDAIELKLLTDERAREHRPFYVYQLKSLPLSKFA